MFFSGRRLIPDRQASDWPTGCFLQESRQAIHREPIMLTPQNRKLLDSLETKYVTLLAVVSDIARIEMGDAAATSDLEKHISE